MLTSLVDNSENSITFGDWVMRWYKLYKVPKVRQRTAQDMLRNIARLQASTLWERKLLQLTGDDLQEFLLGIESNNSRQKVSLIIKGALCKAVKLGMIIYNPFGAVELPTYMKKHYRPLEYFEVEKILYYYDNAHSYHNYMESCQLYSAVFSILCLTGLRVGEFLALDFVSDVNFEQGYIHVTKSRDRAGNINDSPKTKTSIRKVPFLPELGDRLKHIKHLLEFRDITYNGIKMHFNKLYKRLDIKGANIHTFRHTFISLCYAVGMREKLIQIYAGHADVSTTLNIYTHILDRGDSRFITYIRELNEQNKLS